MNEEILSSNELKDNFKKKINNIFPRLNQLLDNLNIENNINKFYLIFEALETIEKNTLDLENKLDENLINDLEEKNRIIDQKILKLFTPFILYYKLCLMNN